MNLFEEIVKESSLLTELRQNREQEVINAIKKMRRMRISYDDKKGGKGKRERFIFPVAYGLTRAGNKAIRAFQTAGSTKRGFPKWKLFLFDRIYSMSTEKRSFKEYAQKLIDKGFNITGDKGMTSIFAISPLADSTVQVAKSTDIKYDGPSTKNDITPTQKSQEPSDIQTNKFEPNRINKPNIDTSTVNNYIATKDNNTSVSDNKPMTKDDIVTDKPKTSNVATTGNDITNDKMPDNQQKTGVEAGDSTPETKDDVINKFNDMMTRMNKVNNGDEAEEENDEDKF